MSLHNVCRVHLSGHDIMSLIHKRTIHILCENRYLEYSSWTTLTIVHLQFSYLLILVSTTINNTLCAPTHIYTYAIHHSIGEASPRRIWSHRSLTRTNLTGSHQANQKRLQRAQQNAGCLSTSLLSGSVLLSFFEVAICSPIIAGHNIQRGTNHCALLGLIDAQQAHFWCGRIQIPDEGSHVKVYLCLVSGRVSLLAIKSQLIFSVSSNVSTNSSAPYTHVLSSESDFHHPRSAQQWVDFFWLCVIFSVIFLQHFMCVFIVSSGGHRTKF